MPTRKRQGATGNFSAAQKKLMKEGKKLWESGGGGGIAGAIAKAGKSGAIPTTTRSKSNAKKRSTSSRYKASDNGTGAGTAARKSPLAKAPKKISRRDR
jgi:hypothetical protein